MTPGGARQAVVGSFVVTGALASVRDVKDGRHLPRVTIFVGCLVAAAVLAALADAAPELVGSLAILVLLSSLIHFGPATIGAATSALGK